MYRKEPLTPLCRSPLPGVSQSVQPFPIVMLYLLVCRYSRTKSPYGGPYCLRTSSIRPCGVLGSTPFTSTDAMIASRASLSRYMSDIALYHFATQHIVRWFPTFVLRASN